MRSPISANPALHASGSALELTASELRSPDDAKMKEKMVFAASKDTLIRALNGVETKIQATESYEVSYESGMFPNTVQSYVHYALLIKS